MKTANSVGVSLPQDLLAKIDAERGDIPRSKFLQRLLEQAYAQKEKLTTLTQAANTGTIQNSEAQ